MGKKGTKRKTRWRVLPIGEDGGSGSGNEEDGDCENVGGSAGTYARATQQQRTLRRPNNRGGGGTSSGGYYKQQYHHNSRSYNHDNHQPLVTTEKQIFNEEEYTKITTPRQDVLFKKGYLGRKRPPTTETTDQTTSADVANGNAVHYDPSAPHNEGLDNDPNEMLEEQPQFIYTNGFVDQSGVYYINGSGYEIYDPYSGQVTVIVGPHYGPNGGPPVLAAVPCQPVPLQPLEWFNPPGFLPYVTAPCHNGLARDRRKRYSTDSQNCSPQSSESTGPPGSPQESDEVAVNGGPEGAMYHPHHHPPPPPYVYPGYMFGAPMYNMNGVTVQSTPNAAPSSDVGGKRRKKKRRRRRRRNGVEDGSEESSSEDKEHEEEPMSVTSQESSLESDSKLSTSGEPPPPSRPVPADAFTQTTAPAAPTQSEEAVEDHQQPPPDDSEPVVNPVVNGVDDKEVKELIVHEVTNHLNGGSLNHKENPNKDIVVVVNGDRLVNGNTETKKKAEKKGKKVVNGLTNGVGEKREEVNEKQFNGLTNGVKENRREVNGKQFDGGLTNGVEEKREVNEKQFNGLTNGVEEKRGEVNGKEFVESDDFVFQDDSFLYTQEFVNGNVKVDLDEDSEWITVKGHKGSQSKRSDPGRFGSEERKIPSELTNGHAKARDYKGSGVNGKYKLSKTDKGCFNGKIEEKCTYTKVKQSEAGNKEKTQVNGKGRVVNGSKMDGNEKEIEGERKTSVEKEVESQRDVPKKAAPEVEDAPPTKPSRRERKSQKNVSPPKTPEVSILTATAKPFEMPSVSLRPETFVRQVHAPQPDNLSREDSLLAALTFNISEANPALEVAKSVISPTKEEAASRETKKTSEATKKVNHNGEKKKKGQQSPDSSKVDSLKDLTTKSIETEQIARRQVVATTTVVKSLKEASKEFLSEETRRQNEIPKTETCEGAIPPVAPPRRKKWRASSPGKVAPESTDESSSSSSQESEESVIECLSSGFNSPKAKITSGFSSDDEDIIYQGNLDDQDPKALKRISESQEDSTSLNGKPKRNNGKPSKVVPVVPLPEVTLPSIEPTSIYKTEEHLRNVQKMAKEIVDSVIEEAMKESVRLKYPKDVDPVKLGITDAVTRWLRSQSPDVLSLPRNEDSESELSEDLEADAEERTANGSKNLKSNPLPAPSVEGILGDVDGRGRRVANIISETNDLKEEMTTDLEDDAISNGSVPCGEWDSWDCQHSFAQNYVDMINRSHGKRNTKNTDELNIIPKCCDHVVKYDPLANDTFSTTLDATQQGVGCVEMCDPGVNVAKYYVLAKSLSPVEDIEDSDPEDVLRDEDLDGYRVSLAEELARLEQPLPASWAVEPIRVSHPCRCVAEDSRKREREGMSVFKRKLVGRLKGEGAPFPCGGICCILQ